MTCSNILRGASRPGRGGVMLAALLCSLPALAGASPPEAIAAAVAAPPAVRFGAEASAVSTPSRFDGDVRNLPQPLAWRPGDPIREIPKGQPGQQDSVPAQPAEPRPNALDPLVQLQYAVVPSRSQRAFNTPLLNFEGQGFSSVNPPDTVGEVGIDHYIQAINGNNGTRVRIYDKETGAQVANFILHSLAPGGTPCSTGLGDPILLFDRLANRWLLSEFSSSGNRMCVYISQTSDPVSGGWYAYDFQAPSFPDYPKYGVWPNAYYVGTNENTLGLYAFDRARMLAGQPATFIRTSTTKLSGFGFQMLQPADFNGDAPPPDGAPGIFMRHRDTEAHGPAGNGSQDFLEIFFMQPDFVTPANTTLTGPVSIPVSEFDSTLCGLSSFNCFAQPGTTTTLDPLREPVMWRLQYRNFGTHETLVGNLVTDVNGADRGGIRWFELRRSGGLAGSWSLFQEGTYSLGSDNLNRFMGSISMDRVGNIALGFGANSSTSHPSIRYTGRLAGDPAGTMTQGEIVLAQGNFSNSSNRWGDYSSLNIDPVDDCTFWYTHQYNPSSTSWSTRIGKFAFDQCFVPAIGLAATNTEQAICRPGTLDPIVATVTDFYDFSGTVALSTIGQPAGFSGSFSPGSVSVPPSANSTLNLSVDGSVAPGQYAFEIDASATGVESRRAAVDVTVFADAPTAPGLLSPPAGATNQAVNGLTFSWSAVPAVGSYLFELATDPGFGNIVFSASTSATSITPPGLLAASSTYHWRVSALNACGTEVSAVRSFTTANVACQTFASTDVPKTIRDATGGGPRTSTSVLSSSLTGEIVDVDVLNLGGTHSFINDLDFTLRAPNNTAVQIMARSCADEADFNLNLDDGAAGAAGGWPCPPVGGGTYRPSNPLSGFNGLAPNGTWTLAIRDNAQQDSGNLTSWSLRICAQQPPPPNQAPVADAQTVTTPFETAVAIVLTGSDPDGDQISFNAPSAPANGVLSGTAPNLTYTPNAGFSGNDGFSFTVSDGQASSAPALVSITVEPRPNQSPVLDAPLADRNDDEGDAVSFSIAANFSDPDGDTLEFSISGALPSGIGFGAGSFSGTLGFDAAGSYPITVTAEDDFGGSVSDDFVWNVANINRAPTANDNSYAVNRNATLNVAAPGVLGNDSDPDGDNLLAVIETDVSNGSLALAANGGFTYSPDADFCGSDGFSYRANDGELQSDPANVSIAISCTNQSPTTTGILDQDSAEGELVSLDVSGAFSDPDGDDLSLSTGSDLPQGLSFVGGVFSGELSFDAEGVYPITVTADDGNGGLVQASFTWTVTNTNRAPTTTGILDQDSAEGELVSLDVSGAFSDPDGDDLTLSTGSDLPDGLGFAAGVFSGTLSFTSAGSYPITVTASDGNGGSVQASFTWVVANTNRAPVAADDAFNTGRDTALTVPAPGVLGNDSDPDGDGLGTVLVDDVANGSLALAGNGGFVYTPAAGFCGADGFSYRASDGTLQSGIASVSITVACDNQAPVAGSLADDSATELLPYSRDVSGAFSDPDGEELAFSATGLPASLSIDSLSGVISGTPAFGERGSYEVVVRASDGEGLFAEAGFVLTVGAAAPLPDGEIFSDGFEQP